MKTGTAAANAAYSLELQALAQAAGQPAPTQALELAPVPPETCEAVLGALAEIEPEGAADLRRLWPGAEMGRLLRDVETWWVAGGCRADKEACRTYLRQLMQAQSPGN